MFSQPLDTLLLQELAVAFPEVVHAPGVVFTAVERKREAADLEASLDHLGGDGCPCVLAPRGDGPTPRRCQLARAVYLLGVHAPQQPLHLLVEHAVQRLDERSQTAWDEDDDGVGVLLEGLNERVVIIAKGCAFETPHNSALVYIRIAQVGVSAQGCRNKEGSK